MATTEELSARLERLRKARDTGARVIDVESDGTRRRVEYRTDAELCAAIADLEKRLAGSAGAAPPPNTIRIRTSRGM